MPVRDQLEVHLSGTHAGTLTRRPDGGIEFDYAAQYRALRAAPPLSVSMPRSVAHHGPDVASPWIDNLLPDADDVRSRWASEFGERSPSAFNLLRHMGADCAGAVQVVPPGATPLTSTMTPLAEPEIADHLRALRTDDTAWAFEQHGGRFSLGGQQGKFALTRTSDGQWHQPDGRSASTHIFKIGMTGLPGSDAAEFVTMRAARDLGMPVAGVAIEHFGDQVAVVVERFDRTTSPHGEVNRVHQEDLCQASGLWRTAKYQSDGGPSVSDITTLLRRTTTRGDAHHEFARAIAFNWIAAGTDGHAKNYALLHVGAQTVLAPLYDLISASLVWSPETVQYKRKLAMKFGGEYRLQHITGRHLIRAAEDLRVDPDWFVETVRSYATDLPDAVRVAATQASSEGLLDPHRADAFVDRIAARARRALDTSTDAPSSRRSVGQTWVPEHVRNGQVIAGHWRSQPGR